jgi:hypothetical protein
MEPEELDLFPGTEVPPLLLAHRLPFYGQMCVSSKSKPAFSAEAQQPHPLFKGFIAAAHQQIHHEPL